MVGGIRTVDLDAGSREQRLSLRLLVRPRFEFARREVVAGQHAQHGPAKAREAVVHPLQIVDGFRPRPVAQRATHRSERVQLAGAANTLVFSADGDITADNTDGLGLVADITRNAQVTLTGRDVLLVGAGGAAAGALGPLLYERPRRVVVTNRTQARAEALVQSHAALATLQKVELSALDIQALEGHFDVIINATASSLAGAVVPVPASVLRPGSLAYDMMYGPAAQAFLGWAEAHGAAPRDGLGMLVEQAAEAFALWRGVRPPAAQVLAELRAVVAADH